jgi:hypothetical protein
MRRRNPAGATERLDGDGGLVGVAARTLLLPADTQTRQDAGIATDTLRGRSAALENVQAFAGWLERWPPSVTTPSPANPNFCAKRTMDAPRRKNVRMRYPFQRVQLLRIFPELSQEAGDTHIRLASLSLAFRAADGQRHLTGMLVLRAMADNSSGRMVIASR